jgi:predicted ATPase
VILNPLWPPSVNISIIAKHGSLSSAKTLRKGCRIRDLSVNQGARWYAPELYRLKGELLLQQHADNQAEAEICFHQAIAIAQSQQAKSLELRAATSMARLWQQQGKRTEARDLLAPIFGWFTEGFDTADLREAKAMLEALA